MRAIIFNQQNMTAADLGFYANAFANRRTGVMSGLTMTTANGIINIASGRGLICGRMFAVDGTDSVSAPEVTSGSLFCRLVCEVDLSQTSTAQACNQIAWKILQSSSAYPTLTQQDLNEHPTDGVYQMPMAKFTVSTDGIANWVDERPVMDVFLTGTLVAGSTSLVISDSSITENGTFDIYCETLADGTPVNPTKQLAGTGTLTLTFEAQEINIGVKVKVVG